jgi:hypothetical protein
MKENKLKTETVKALTIVNTHLKDFSYSELFFQISKEKVFLEEVHRSDKIFRRIWEGFRRLRPTFYFCMHFLSAVFLN